MYAEAAGIARILPAAVAVPIDADDVSCLVVWARDAGHSLTPRGSGSSMAGGALGSGVVVDLSRFCAPAQVDRAARTVRVGTGVVRDDIETAAHAVGLRFPVDPSSGAFCTIGGMIATNAAGARTLRYGSTRPWVRGLYCVFDDGSRAWIRRDEALPLHVPAVSRLDAAMRDARANAQVETFVHAGVRKESSGYGVAAAIAPHGHLIDLLVGSEGTLALFLEAELALCPMVRATASVLASFPTLERASECAVQAREAGASACELLDRTFLDIAATDGALGVASGAEAVLLIEVEGDDASDANAACHGIATSCRAFGAIDIMTAIEQSHEARLWALRHAASPILARLAPRVRSMQFIEDGCVPPERFASYVLGVRATLTRFDVPGVIFGHAGDAHAHVNPLIDMHESGWRDRVRGIFAEVSALTARLGGTMSGEHGDGRLRAPTWPQLWSAQARNVFAQVKLAADPRGTFNAGCKVSRAGDESIADVRYDSSVPPLDPRARTMLDVIERDRRWNRFRLSDSPLPDLHDAP